MNTNYAFLIFIFLSSLLTQPILLAKDPLPLGGDTLVVDFRCDREHLAKPYFLLAHAGDIVEFKAVSGAFSVLINNADTFFEGVEDTETFLVDTDNNTSTPGTISYSIKSDLEVGTEIPYTLVCLISGKIIGGSDDDAPPKIIIVPRDDF